MPIPSKIPASEDAGYSNRLVHPEGWQESPLCYSAGEHL
jgi:hypothetical protein